MTMDEEATKYFSHSAQQPREDAITLEQALDIVRTANRLVLEAYHPHVIHALYSFGSSYGEYSASLKLLADQGLVFADLRHRKAEQRPIGSNKLPHTPDWLPRKFQRPDLLDG